MRSMSSPVSFKFPLFLLGLILCLSPRIYSQSDWMDLFDGHTLEGWKTVNPKYADLWYVHDNAIVSGDGEMLIPENTYLHTLEEFEDFELRCLFRLTGDPKTGMINSGIQYRSFIRDGMMIGYQADIGKDFWGGLYDEHRRAQLVVGDMEQLQYVLRPNDWNSYTIRVKGNHHQLFINGVQTVDYYEEDPDIPTRGIIAIQNHSGGNAQVAFKYLRIRKLD